MLIKKPKVIIWREFFRIEKDGMVTLKVIPDRTADNKQNHKLIRALHELYDTPIARLSFSKWRLSYRPQERFWYDVVLTKDAIAFFVTIPKRWEVYTRQKISACWSKVSVQYARAKEMRMPTENTQVIEMAYKRHDIFALNVNRTEDTQPIGNIMRVSHDMKESDLVRLVISAEPVNRMNWNDKADQAYMEFAKKNKTPQRTGLSLNKAKTNILRLLENTFQGFGETLLQILGHGESEKKAEADYEKREVLIDGKLDRTTLNKKTEPTFKTCIRIASNSTDKMRREINLRAMANAFVEVAGDNELEKVEVKRPGAKARILYEINNHELKPMSILQTDVNIMSASELGKLMQIPGAGLQDEYSEKLETIKLRQTELPTSVTKGGLQLGNQEYKDTNVPVYLPLDNIDEACLSTVVIGGMGCGKTKGFAANRAVQAVKNNLGCIVIDPARREIGEVIAKALPPDKIIRIDLSKMVIALDWNEVKYSPRAKARLANTMLSFFNASNDDAGMQTARYIRASVMGMKTGRLSEILRIFEDDVYRQKIVKDMSEGLNKTTLQGFGKLSDARQQQILSPIFNRMNDILSDSYLSECMDAEKSLDMVHLMQQRKAIIIDIPADYFDPISTDIIVNLLATKIDLAMRLRPEKNQFPFYVIFDEPHQYLRSATLWKAAAVESRKWRLGYVWMFHSWEQIPRDLAEIIKAAGPHYHLYTSSQKTYKDLNIEIQPFTLEEAIATPRFHAINVLRCGGVTVKPFMAKMLAPPSMLKVKIF